MCLHTCTWWPMTHAQCRTMFGCSLTHGDDRPGRSEENRLWLEMSSLHQGKWHSSSWILNNTAQAGHSYSSHGSLECYRGVIRGVERPPCHVWAMENRGEHLHSMCGILGAGIFPVWYFGSRRELMPYCSALSHSRWHHSSTVSWSSYLF